MIMVFLSDTGSRRRQGMAALCLLYLLVSIAEAKRSSGLAASSLRLLRGGSSGAGGGGESSVGDIDDDELDDYIDFLLAAAEDKVTEDENPLFKRFRGLVAAEQQQQETTEAFLEEKQQQDMERGEPDVVITTSSAMEPVPEPTEDFIIEENGSTPVEEGTLEFSEPIVSDETNEPEEEEEEDLRPLVDDVEDEAQLDEMIEALVATVEEVAATVASSEHFDLVADEEGPEEVSSVEEMLETIVEEVMEEKTEELITEAAVVVDTSSEEAIKLESMPVEMSLDKEESIENIMTQDAFPVELSHSQEAVVDQKTGTDIPIGETEARDGAPSPIVLEDQTETFEEQQLLSEVTITQPVEMAMEDQAVPEISIAEEAIIATEEENEIKIEKSTAEESSPEFFLGPSAVGKSPQLVEEAIRETEETAAEQLKTKDEPVVPGHLTDLKSTSSALPKNPVKSSSGWMPATYPMLSSTLNAWGQKTARLLGIKGEAERSTPSTGGDYVKSWGKFTALLIGIKDGSDTQQNKDPARDYDRIYQKYFADYVPDPAVYGYPEDEKTDSAVEEESGANAGESGGIFSEPKKQVAGFWGTLGKLMNQERGKPLEFFSSETQTTQDHHVNDVGATSVSEGEDVAIGGQEPESPLQDDDECEQFVFESSVDVDGKEGEKVESPRFLDDGLHTSTDGSADGDSTDNLVTPSPDESFEGSKEEESEELFETDFEVQLASETTAPEPVALLGSQKQTEGEESISEQIETDTTEPIPMDGVPSSSSETVETVVDSTADAKDVNLAEDAKDIVVASVSELDDYYEEYDDEPQDDTLEEIDIFDESGYESDVIEEDFEAIESEDAEYIVYTDPIAERPAAWALETEAMNFFYKFLALRGMEGWLMMIVLLVEWCRVYLSPFVDFVKWVSSGEFRSTSPLDSLRNDLVSRLRGGSEDSDSLGDENLGSDDPSSPDSMNASSSEVEPKSEPSVVTNTPRSRPNPLYRHLFGYGRLGHVLIMECILLNEWVDTYVPALSAALAWAAHQMFPSMRSQRDFVDEPLSQTTGFVGADGSAVRGAKKKSSQTRKEDQKALTQLQRVGDVTQAKYRFLSENFMKRHGIGQFADEFATSTKRESDKPRAHLSATSKEHAEEEPESDAEWIVSALTQDGKEEDNDISADPYLYASKSSAPKITVGFEIGGSSRPKRRKRSAISDVTRLTSSTEKKKITGPRVSDRESGVMGRIRAAGANSLVGRSLLGAYPGDVPPPGEAANPHGLFDLAEKYGYGEWSDMEDDFQPEPRRRKRRSRRSEEEMEDSFDMPKVKKKRRRNTSRLELDFDLGGMSSPTTTSTVMKATNRKEAEMASSDTPMKKIRSAQETKQSVASSGRDAFNQRAERLARGRRETESESSGAAKDPMAIIREAKSEPGANSVANAGLRHLKDRKKAKGDDESK